MIHVLLHFCLSVYFSIVVFQERTKQHAEIPAKLLRVTWQSEIYDVLQCEISFTASLFVTNGSWQNIFITMCNHIHEAWRYPQKWVFLVTCDHLWLWVLRCTYYFYFHALPCINLKVSYLIRIKVSKFFLDFSLWVISVKFELVLMLKIDGIAQSYGAFNFKSVCVIWCISDTVTGNSWCRAWMKLVSTKMEYLKSFLKRQLNEFLILHSICSRSVTIHYCTLTLLNLHCMVHLLVPYVLTDCILTRIINSFQLIN